MKIVNSALENYRFTIVIMLTIVLLGLLSFLTMPRSEDPQLSFSIDYLVVIYPGASVLDMEQLVVDPIEDAINSLEDLKEIKTDIRDGMAKFRIEFEHNTDPDKKHDDIVNAVAGIRNQLPQNLAKLEVKKLSPTDVNIFQLALTSETASYRDLRLYAERLENSIERLNGVKGADIWAIPQQTVQVTLDFDKMKHYNLSMTESYKALQGVAANIPGGHVNTPNRRFNIRTSGKYQSLNSIENTLISSPNGRPIYVKDVAKVEFVDSEANYLARYNGERSVFVTAMQNENANIYNVVGAINAELEKFKEQLPSNISAKVVLDKSQSVTRRLGDFFSNLVFGLCFVGLVIFVFLGFRNMVIVITVIPISILIAFGLLDQSGFGIQQMSIVGLIIALGLLVDNAIVVCENIAQKMRQGNSIYYSVTEGTASVGWAITSGTLTTLLSFLPILAMQTSSGAFIRSLPLVVIYSLIASLAVALFITPLLALKLFNAQSGKNQTNKGNPINSGKAVTWLQKLSHGPYQKLLFMVIRKPKTTLILAVVLFLLSLSLFKSVGVSLFPKAENNQVMVNLTLNENASLSETLRITEKVESVLASFEEVKSFTSNVGRGNPRVYYSETPPPEKANRAQLFVQLNAGDAGEFWEIVKKMRNNLSGIVGAEVNVKAFQQGKPIEAPIVLRIYSDNFDVLRQVSDEVESIMKKNEIFHLIENPIGKNKLDFQLNIDKERAALLDIPIGKIDAAVSMSLMGVQVGKFRDEYGDDFPITVKLSKPSGGVVSDLDNIMVENNVGILYPLNYVAKLELISTPAYLQHFNNQRSAKVTAEVIEGQNVEQATLQLQQDLKSIHLPDGVTLEFAGERASRGEAFRGFVKSTIVALFGIFTVLVFQFRSFTQPFIVFVSIPFAISGSILALYLTGYSFSFMAFLGVAGLVGIVVNNAIILIDTANNLQLEGMHKNDACIEASKSRLTPILLTTLTTIVSLLPLALQKSLTWSPLAFTIIGGLAVSTLISLILVPLLYSLFTTAITQPSVVKNQLQDINI